MCLLFLCFWLIGKAGTMKVMNPYRTLQDK